MGDDRGMDRNAADRGIVGDDAQGTLEYEDPIVAEVRAVRDALFAEAGYDLDEFVRRIRAAQERSEHAVVTLPAKPAGSAV